MLVFLHRLDRFQALPLCINPLLFPSPSFRSLILESVFGSTPSSSWASSTAPPSPPPLARARRGGSSTTPPPSSSSHKRPSRPSGEPPPCASRRIACPTAICRRKTDLSLPRAIGRSLGGPRWWSPSRALLRTSRLGPRWLSWGPIQKRARRTAIRRRRDRGRWRKRQRRSCKRL